MEAFINIIFVFPLFSPSLTFYRRDTIAPRNDTEKRVYEALSNKNWGASSTLLNDIARDTYDL